MAASSVVRSQQQSQSLAQEIEIAEKLAASEEELANYEDHNLDEFLKEAKLSPNEEDDPWPEPVIQLTKPQVVGGSNPRSERSNSKDLPLGNLKRRDPALIERTNLLNLAKLCIKELIESALQEGRTLGNEHLPLQQFFAVMEHVLTHGLREKKSLRNFLEKKKEFWGALESIEKIMPEASEMTSSVRNLPGIKTNLGRGRAWLRLALMQKKLADYFRVLLERKDILSEFYEPSALMLEEESVVIAGLLVGLNIIDCNLYLKGDDLDLQSSVIDFSGYLKDGNYLEKPEDSSVGGEGGGGAGISGGGGGSDGDLGMTVLLDQKNYVEELNKNLTANVAKLQARIKDLETSNSQMKEELAVANNNVLTLQALNDQLQGDNQNIMEGMSKKLESAKADIHVERETYNTSRLGLNEMYEESKKKLAEETQLRQDLNKELQLQVSMKQEMEVAIKLLEKDVRLKEDSVAALQKQLEEVKLVNQQLHSKLKEYDGSLKHKTELVGKLEEKTTGMAITMKQIEERLKKSDKDRLVAEESARKLGKHLAEKDAIRAAVETDLKIEREWRSNLEEEVQREKERMLEMQAELQQMDSLKREMALLQGEHSQLNRDYREQEATLSEMGAQLSTHKLRMDDMREQTQILTSGVWTDDKDAAECVLCLKPFSVARRKHHCRNCGGVFCNSCSDNTMPLPSSAKPVRVCDTCHTVLLQRYSASKI